MEGVVADPRLVPENVVAKVPDLLEHLPHVVDRAVVGRELDAREAEGPLGLGPRLVLDERMLGDPLAQARLVPGVPVDGADHAEGVARGRQEYRDGSRLHQRALMQRLVIVAIEEDEIARPQHRVRHHLVGGAGSVQHEIGPVGAEDPRRMLLRLGRRPLVDQEIAEVDVGVAEVVAKDALAEILEEDLPGGRLAIELAALVARAVEGDVRLAVIGHQPAEEGRQQGLAVIDQARDDLLGVEGWGLLPEIDVTVHLADHLGDVDVGDAAGIGERPERGAETQPPDRTHELARLLEPAVLRPSRYRRRPKHPRIRRRRSCREPRPRSPRAAIWSSSSLVCALVASTIATTLSSLWKGMATVGAFTSRGITGSPSSITQSTRYRRPPSPGAKRRPWISVSKPGKLRSKLRA